MQPLKLIAFDAEDLAVISAHLQDAVLKVGDLAYLSREKRFAAILNRFDWATAAPDTRGKVRSATGTTLARRRTALRFERVLKAQVSGFDLKAKDTVLALLAIQFIPAEAPAGHVTLTFSGKAAVRLEVECIEAEMKDLGSAWETKSRPEHGDDAVEAKPPHATKPAKT